MARKYKTLEEQLKTTEEQLHQIKLNKKAGWIKLMEEKLKTIEELEKAVAEKEWEKWKADNNLI